MALAHVIVNWNIPLDSMIKECIRGLTKIADIKAYHLSHALADAYCAGVYRVLGRAAITPHCVKAV
jgi:hypothetical protein